jgi:hypothetical protein
VEIKLTSVDGLWKYHSVPESHRPFDDVITAFFVPCSYDSRTLNATKRRYQFQGRDNHGMYTYMEVWNG